jgi:indoleamine 2,3-dioxygenase
MEAPIPRLEDYGLSESHGFLPESMPLSRLPDPYYRRLEDIVDNLPALILSGRIRGIVDALPEFSVSGLETDREWRRAYSILCFITHAYIWGGDSPSDRLPKSISIPLQTISGWLQLPPVATYAALCLWNFKPIFDDEGISDIENLSTLNTFTGSLDESWFYLISVSIEAKGAPIIPLMLRCMHAARMIDILTVVDCLERFSQILESITSILNRMHENCDPSTFYNRIRPFLAGSKNMAHAGLPHGVVYENSSGRGGYRQYSGGSNAQSSLIQFFDVVLGVEHGVANPTKFEHSQPSSTSSPSINDHFLLQMRKYMPGTHAKFLADVSAAANIKALVKSHPHDDRLCLAYDSCLASLGRFRDRHIAIVYRYVIMQTHDSSKMHLEALAKRSKVNLASPISHVKSQPKQTGTGGTLLIPFLRSVRDETTATMIHGRTHAVHYKSRADQKCTKIDGVMPKLPDLPSITLPGLTMIWTSHDVSGGICHH